MSLSTAGLRVHIRGIVQGVGFRPFIYTLAEEYGLTGWVNNTSAGVEIEVNGPQASLDAFVHSIQSRTPPLARIDSLTTEATPVNGYAQFEIRESLPLPGEFIPVSPDVAICPDCRRELFSPSDRRFRYPFINCTHCGPRFSIIRDIPYDRPLTTMSGFPLCPDCAREYHDPRDRRFHAQPVACPVCGPQIWLESGGKRLSTREGALTQARHLLAAGKILAVKGLGGFHLACDAANPAAVAELRRRKKRSDKPFALMAWGVEQVEPYCHLTGETRALLTTRQSPIVLLQVRPGAPLALAEIAPGLSELGVMLAYTPLHLLLLEPEPGFPQMLVMTSGNLSEEPIAYRDEEAIARLAPIADAFLLHDRPIHMRVDDSVVTVTRRGETIYRRARGFAPDPLRLAEELPALLGCGAELKNTFCLTSGPYAFLSHHIGDLENLETLRSYEEGIAHYERLFRVTPLALACDMHPDYLSTRYALERANRENLPLIQVQHHHAHLAACLADNGLNDDQPVIGLTFDGTGFGTDGKIWGGEALVGNFAGFERPWHLTYVPLPGGDAAVRRPARMALAHLWSAGLEWESDLPPVEHLCADERTVLRSQLTHKINAPDTSSMGRLFDAAAALMGIRQQVTYEGQAAIEMEALADPDETGAYPFDLLKQGVFNPKPLWQALLADWRAGTRIPVLSARFHNGVAHLSRDLARILRNSTGISTIALSGGVWQNRYLFNRAVHLLEKDGFTVLTHRTVPANDGGVAVGQAMIAAARLRL